MVTDVTESRKEEAQKWLRRIEEESISLRSFDTYVKFMRESLQEGKLSLSDIGADEVKLQQLRTSIVKRMAKKQFNKLYSCPNIECHDACVSALRKILKEGGLSLSDIGVREIDLAQLRLVRIAGNA